MSNPQEEWKIIEEAIRARIENDEKVKKWGDSIYKREMMKNGTLEPSPHGTITKSISSAQALKTAHDMKEKYVVNELKTAKKEYDLDPESYKEKHPDILDLLEERTKQQGLQKEQTALEEQIKLEAKREPINPKPEDFVRAGEGITKRQQEPTINHKPQPINPTADDIKQQLAASIERPKERDNKPEITQELTKQPAKREPINPTQEEFLSVGRGMTERKRTL
jgi:hypothetical protein